MQKHANLVDLVKSFPTNIYLQNLASIQKRTSPVKFAHLAEKSGKGSISNLSTKVRTDALEQVRVPGLASTQEAPPFLAQAPQLLSNLTKQIRSFVPRLNDQIQTFVPRLNNQLRDVSKWDDAISEEEKSALKKIRSYWEKSLEK